MKVVKLNEKDFDAYSRQYAYTNFQQTSSWGKLKSLVGWRPLYLGCEDNGQLIAAGLFLGKKMPLFNKYLYYCPHGYMLDYENTEVVKECSTLFLNKLKEEKGFECIIDPYFPFQQRDIEGNVVENGFNHIATVDALKSLGYIHSGFNKNLENLQPRFQFRLPLEGKSFDELLNHFRYEAKRRYKKKDFLGIKVRELSREEIPTYKRLMEMTAERRGFQDRPLSYYQEMYDCLSPDILHYFAAEIDFSLARQNIEKEIASSQSKIENWLKKNPDSEKTMNRVHEEEIILGKNKDLLAIVDSAEKERGTKAVLSVVCLLCYGHEAIMLLAGNDEKYLQDFNTSNIIVGELIRYSKENNYKYYNFYGISGDFDPNSPLYGLYSYKKQYDGEVVELIGQFEYTLDRFTKFFYECGLKLYKLTKKH